MPATTLPPKDYTIAPQRGLPLLVLWAILATVAALPPAFTFAERGAAGLAQAGTWLGPGLVLLTGLGMSLAYRRQRIRLDAAGLDIRSTFYRKAVALAALQLERARIVDLAEHAELKPSLKTNGYNLPGFRSGHFRLSGGGKAFCLITDHQRVLVLPLHDGSTLLLSPEHPAQLLRDLQVLAAAGQRH